MNTTVSLTGVVELQKALFSYNQELATKITKVSLRKGANYLRDKLKQAAPSSEDGSFRQDGKGEKSVKFKAGSLKRSIVVRSSRLNKLKTTGAVSLYILIGGRKRMNPRGAYYAKFVEHGYKHGSKLVSSNEAIRLGIFTKAQKDAKKLQYRQNAMARLKPGRKFVKPGSVRVRAGGIGVSGRHFVEQTLNNHAKKAHDLIVQSGEAVLIESAKKLGLKAK